MDMGTPMRLFLLVPDALGKLDGRPFSPLASIRLRCLEIAPHLAKLGHRPRLVIDRDVPAMVRDGSFQEADAYINFKTTFNLEHYLAEAVGAGKPVIFDICDNAFEGRDAAANDSLLSLATLATTPTGTLANLIQARGAHAVEIPDCLEGAGDTIPSAAPSREVRLLWFGRRQNAQPLLECLPDFSNRRDDPPRHLTIVCDRATELAEEIKARSDALAVTPVEWSPSALSAALADCHIVLTPMSTGPRYVTKSANRLTHALYNSRPVATHPFANLDWLTQHVTVAEDLAVAVDTMLADWPGTVERTSAGREAVVEHLHPSVVAQQWDAALTMASARVKTQSPRARGRAGVRLNLGCGDKLLPYYINIDARPERDGLTPDMVLDVRDLSTFEDNSVDEVLSVHLIEHLSRMDAPRAIAEWVRVLKPGGVLIIECPDLLTACEAIVKDPGAAHHHDGEIAQRSMWAIFGDPGDGDPLMMHQWGYTAESLGDLLTQAGLEDVRSEPARFKLGPPRDLRLVGIKPIPRPVASSV